MRRLAALICALLLIICVAPAVLAAPAARSGELHAAVSADGTAQVNLSLTLRLDAPTQGLTFPLPENARSITLNGGGASVTRRDGAAHVSLDRVAGAVAGDVTVALSYEIPSCVQKDSDGSLVLTLPLLTGFGYPIEKLNFSITLPGEITARPVFHSVYHQSLIAEKLDFTVTGAQLQGTTTGRIMDRDTVTVTLAVTEEMFPQEKPIVWEMNLDDVLMIACGVLALLYWLVALRCLPPRRIYTASPPETVSAGEVNVALTRGRADLTMLVVHWAQLGYILIHLDDNGRVFLHKRMNMGNERSAYENRVYNALFGKRKTVDGTGLHYAQLCRKVASGKTGVTGLFRRDSGNPLILRLILCLLGILAGVALGKAFGGDSLLTGLLCVIFGIFGPVSAWIIQEGCHSLHRRSRLSLCVSLALSALWLVLGILSAELPAAAGFVLAQLLGGFGAAYGGRRTELGRQAASQVLGLRRYLTSVKRENLQRILRSNPEYYYTLAPYALALGVDQSFARRFGPSRLPACPYLTAGMDGHMTALEWSSLLRDAVSALDQRQQQLFWERLTGR